jgi:hypothetical protein
MTISQMPGDPHQGGRVRAADFRQFLGRGDDFDDASVVQSQAVAGAQHHRFGQVKQKSKTTYAGHRDTAPIAIVIVEDDRVGRFAGPGASGTDGMCVLHGIASVNRRSFAPRHRSFPYAPWAH